MSLSQRQLALLLIAPGLALVSALFLYPLGFSLVSAFTARRAAFSLSAFRQGLRALFRRHRVHARHRAGLRRADRARRDRHRRHADARREALARRRSLRSLYRWPLFIPFIVAAQCMRTFLAKNGLMNNTFVALGLIEPLQTMSFLDWRGIVITFVWKQTPVRDADARRRHGLARPRDHRGRAQSRRLAAAGPHRDRAAAGGADAARRPRALLRDDALGALGAADGRRLAADHAHRRHGLPHQLLRRLRDRQRARRHLLRDDRAAAAIIYLRHGMARGGAP